MRQQQLLSIAGKTSLLQNQLDDVLLYNIMPHFLDPELIFPKRLGLMHSNILVLEYYDLTRDKFKKHQMHFQAGGDAKTIV